MKCDGKKIAFLGDSITNGECLDDRNNSYVEIVKRSFSWAEVHRHSLPGSRIGNYIGKDPRNIGPSFVERYPEMPEEMDIVVVFGGTNDFGIGNDPIGNGRDCSADTFCGALNLLMEGLKKKYENAVIVFITPLHRKNEKIPNAFTKAFFVEYIDAIRKQANEHGIQLLDLYAAESLQPTDKYFDSLIRADGIHPNDAGHQIIAMELIKFLKAI